ncbi:succinate dehydrogenase, hydrophobic membrane anchor protein [Sinirhodobacter huangdaonensis]|jgi:succinate dehydrogenase / fumarate reductase membrane anchor subunit|uniref:Succinate dehydrogenase hydrophobic membrane anchor subunit n=1 Tax=Paenirhodobacter huangdaonensis TaxID=2501515 RepID=A0A3S3NB84_9RHOB|nr:succinate dehydrogenase, hydrophobic membrane anchor protein [Sinirhodobacter huangdaonensis]RWR53288.1 succinate dehydrogenase, hydrophobic membrane anchor protein [Sinirhodobacter huangdaonensis]
MHYLTDRKRAVGKGASHTGTEHHWYMTVSAVALAFLVPVFLIVFGRALGQSQEGVIATFSRPFPAILTALVVVVGMRHFAKGAQMMIEDYTAGMTRKVLVIAAYSVAYLVIAVALYALAKMTFLGVVLGAMN